MTAILLILVALIVIGFIRFQSQKRREKQESQGKTPSPDLDPIPDRVVDTTCFYKEILSPEESPEDQGQAVPEPKPKKSPAPKKSPTKKTPAKKTTAKKSSSKKVSPKKPTK